MYFLYNVIFTITKQSFKFQYWSDENEGIFANVSIDKFSYKCKWKIN
jgi:hypothetical protein